MHAPPSLFPLLLALLSTLALSWPLALRSRTLHEAARRRAAALASRLALARLALERDALRRTRARLRLDLELRTRAEAAQRDRLRPLLAALQRRDERAYASRARSATRAAWHAVDADGRCPAAVPEWEWKLLLHAAVGETPRQRHEALQQLQLRSRLDRAELQRLASRYRGVLTHPEFAGILNISHPPCGGRRHASMSAGRVLRIDCDGADARYAVDDARELRPYASPVRIGDAESVVAFCGEELNLLAHPLRREAAVARAHAVPQPAGGGRRPSVLVFMVDATSRAHFRRSLPKTLAALDRIAERGGAAGGGGRRDAAEGAGKLHVFDFEQFNIVGYNSMPNQLPFFCDATPEDLSTLDPAKCVWEAFKREGAVTMIAEEVHDGCEGATSIANALMRTSYLVQQRDLPDHEWWRVFCSPHIKPCCWAKEGFLNPGRRQCIGGGRELHQLMISYVEEFFATYQDVPRRWAAINTNIAHEHFMLRLGALDADLARMLLRMAGGVLQDTVLFLMSDHGTHGIWYTEFEIGTTEHQLPFLYMVLPDWILRERPEWHAALKANQRRLVTVRELYRAMLQLAKWPEAAPKSADGKLSVFDELPPTRTCEQAGIPDVYCACRAGSSLEP